MKILNKIDKIILILSQAFCAFLLLMIIIVCFSNTVARYMFNSPWVKAEETCIYLAIWLALVGGSLTARQDAHTALDLLQSFIKNKKIKIVLYIFTRVLCIFVLAALMKPSFEMVKIYGPVLSPSTRVPLAVLYYSFPVGAVLMILGYIRVIPEKVREMINDDIEPQNEAKGEKEQ